MERIGNRGADLNCRCAQAVLQRIEMSPVPPASDRDPSSAVERAEAYGLDLTLLVENLRRSPTDRLRWAERALHSVVAFQEEARRALRLSSSDR
jgi:hypothetical protein